MIMMRLAIQTLPGTDVDSAYSAALPTSKRSLLPAIRTPETGRRRAYPARSDGGATLQVECARRQWQADVGLKFQGRFERPTDRRADLPVALAERKSVSTRGGAPMIAPGQWDLVLEGDAAGSGNVLSKNRVVLN